MNKRQIVWYCGLLMTLSAFCIDILLPAFSVISQSLDASYGDVQLTIPVFIFAFGAGQFFVGPLSDRYGRKTVLVCGQFVFLLGSLVGVIAGNIEILLAARVLQGLGGSVGHVVGRALLRDLFSGKELGRAMALAAAVFAFGPIVAPLTGVLLMQFADWRSLFLLMALFAVVLLAVAIFALPETNTHINPAAMRPRVWKENLVWLFAHPESRSFLLLSGIIMAMMLCILTTIPKIYDDEFGVRGAAFALYFAAHGIGIPIGQVANRWLIARFGLLKATLCGSAVLILASSLILALGISGHATALGLTMMLILFATSYLIVYSNAAALTLEPHPHMAGFASSVYGAMSQIFSSIIAVLVASLVGGSLVTFSMVLLFLAVFVFIAILAWALFDGRKGAHTV